MTKDELERLILMKNGKKLIEKCKNLSEDQRRTLAAHAVKLHRYLCDIKVNSDVSKYVKELIKKRKRNQSCCFSGVQNASLAIYAMCSLTTIKRETDTYNCYIKELYQILEDRKPKWLGKWLEYNLDTEGRQFSIYEIFNWVDKGYCHYPKSNRLIYVFIDSMAEDNRQSKSEKYLPISERVQKDKRLIDFIWKLFEIEHNVFSNFALREGYYYFYQNKTPKNYENWIQAIFKLSQQGIIDRKNLFNKILLSLHMDIKQNQKSGIIKLHDLLQPSIKELEMNQLKYIELLSNKIAFVVKFALKVVSLLQNKKLLNNHLVLREIINVFYLKTKANAVSSLKIIDTILMQVEDCTKDCIRPLVQALQHDNTDVQAISLEILNRIKSKLNDKDKVEIEKVLDFVSPSLKSDLFALIKKKEPVNDLQIVNVAKLVNVINDMPKNSLKMAGLDEIDFKLETYGRLKNVNANFPLYSIMKECEEIQPINSIEELIKVISSAIEGVMGTEDLDRILDGINRIPIGKCRDFEKLSAPLVQRLKKNINTHESIVGFFIGYTQRIVKQLLLNWLLQTNQPITIERNNHLKISELLDLLLTNINSRLLRHEYFQLFSTPTHKGGWIRPLLWVKRIHAFIELNLPLDKWDFCISIMRLMPEEKKIALNYAQKIKGKLGRLARYVLGESLSTLALRKSDKYDYELWFTAAYFINPLQNFSETFKVFEFSERFYQQLQLSFKPSSIALEKVKEYDFSEIDWDIVHNKKIVQFNGSKDKYWRNIPLVFLLKYIKTSYPWYYTHSTEWQSKWLHTLMPSNLEYTSAILIKQILARINMSSSKDNPIYGCFYFLFKSLYVYSPTTHLLLAFGLTTKDKDANLTSLDAYVESVDKCRLNEKCLSDAIVRLIDEKWITFQRLANSFKQIAFVSPLHAYSVSKTIQSVLSRIDLKLRGLFCMLELLLEINTELQIPLTKECQYILTCRKGGDKTAKTAEKLAKLNFDPNKSEKILKLKVIEHRLNMIKRAETVLKFQ